MQQAVEKAAESAQAVLWPNHVFVKDQSVLYKVHVNDIYYLEADGSYCKVFTEHRNFHTSKPMKHILERLSHPQMLKVSRKHVININHVESLMGRTAKIRGIDIQISDHVLKRIKAHMTTL